MAPAQGPSSPARPQPVAAPAAQAAPAPVPDRLSLAKLIWSAMAALDQANQTGNYSVLRDLGAPSFQSNNSAATLAGIFQELRAQDVDLSNAFLVGPSYEFAPAIIQGGLLRTRGTFSLRPVGIAFDLLFQNVGGQWRIFGISVVALPTQPPQSVPTKR